MIIKTLLFAGFRVTKGLPKGLPENDSARNVPNRVLYDFISRFLMVESVQVLLSAEIKVTPKSGFMRAPAFAVSADTLPNHIGKPLYMLFYMEKA